MLSSSGSSRQRGEAPDDVPGQRESKSGSEIARGESGRGRGRALTARAFSETHLRTVTSPEAMTSSAAWPRPRRKRRGHTALRLRAKLVAAGHLRPIASAPRAAGNRPLRGRSKLLRCMSPQSSAQHEFQRLSREPRLACNLGRIKAVGASALDRPGRVTLASETASEGAARKCKQSVDFVNKVFT